MAAGPASGVRDWGSHSAGTAWFEVKDVVPVKRLKAELAARGVGKVEILVCGADIDPDQLRKQMKLKGAATATVVIAQLGERGSKTNAVWRISAKPRHAR